MDDLQPTRTRNCGSRYRGVLPGLLLAGLGGIALAVGAGLEFRLPSGRPGPGFVPVLVAAALSGLGLLLALAALARGAAASGLPARPGLMLCGAVIAFGLLQPIAGFLPAAWASAALALLATPGLGPARALAGGFGLSWLAVALFLGLLGIPAPLIGPR
jgi:hypothetical protein